MRNEKKGTHEHQHNRNQKFLNLGGFLDCSFNGPAARIGGQIDAAWALIGPPAKPAKEKKNISTETLCKKSASIFPTCSGNIF